MSERSREKIALVVFAFLVVFAGCCLGGYLVAGHSWNVAATNIDDTFGSLDGYTVIAYAGTVEEKKTSAAASSAGQAASDDGRVDSIGYDDALKGSSSELNAGESSGSGESSLSSAANGQNERNEQGEQNADSPSFSGSEQTSDAGSSVGGQAASGSSSAQLDEENGEGAGVQESASVSSPAASSEVGGETEGAQDSRESRKFSSTSSSDDEEEAISADEVRQSYEDKGATVFLLDTEHLGRYSEGTILEKGGHRFGVFSIEKPMTLLNIMRMVRYFERHEVDFIVAVVADNRLLRDVEGIDIVVSTKNENLFAMGETKNGTFYVNAPEVGKVGAVLISPSNVVSAKVIDSL